MVNHPSSRSVFTEFKECYCVYLLICLITYLFNYLFICNHLAIQSMVGYKFNLEIIKVLTIRECMIYNKNMDDTVGGKSP